MRSTIISLAILMTIASSYSVEASLGDAAHHTGGSVSGAVSRFGGRDNAAPAVASKLERRSFTSRSRAITRAKLQRRNSSLLPDIVLPSITSAQPSSPAVARPIPQAVSYPAAAAAAPVSQSYYIPQPEAQGYTTPQQAAASPNYTPQKQQQAAPALAPPPYYYTPQVQQPAATVPATPKLTLPTLIQPAKEKENDNDDSDDEEEEDEDEEDEEDYDADDLVTRR
ncbi:uncharacterized protein ATC70_007052 [Mucor velutinosus]|uniref:Uncharacterized protein n=1 Tax=Mucor velutinosus TaxID=708070 RepID=A0AAN7HQ98_9FUNG|nr:hypothetical protein ATC70_007052 [Mucor velutinosus]